MLNNFQVICNTAAGRRRYMQYLIPQVVSCPIIDRYDIWINTIDKEDIEFFRQIAKAFPKIALIWQPDGVIDGNNSINAFYKGCVEENAIYIKLDDDIIWMEPEAIEKMVHFRIDNPEYFLVSPLVINNAICTYILQNEKKIKLNKYMKALASHPITCKSGLFATEIHNWFISKQIPNQEYKNLHSGKHSIALNRFSINSILWFGKDMKLFDGIVPGDDEEFLSVIQPAYMKKVNCFNSDVIISHFAFKPQRKVLDKKDILNRYGNILHKEWSKNSIMLMIDKTIQSILLDIEKRKDEISLHDLPYRENSKKKGFLNIFLVLHNKYKKYQKSKKIRSDSITNI